MFAHSRPSCLPVGADTDPSAKRFKMKSRHNLMIASLVAVAASTGCSSMMMKSDNLPTATGDTRPEPVVVVVPVQLTDPALQSGCWVQFYNERNFSGDIITMTGPGELQSADKGTGKELKRHIDSLVTGPKATLRVYEHALFKDRAVTFGPNSREGGLITRLGFGGNIQSLQLECAS